MDEILKSEIYVVIYEKKNGVLMEEFGGLFRQIHGYNLKLSKYGYSSLRMLLNDMNDLVQLRTINGQQFITCKSRSLHHVVVSKRKNFNTQEQISGLPSVPLSSSAISPDPVVIKPEQLQLTSLQQHHHVKQVIPSKSNFSSKCSLPAKKTDSVVWTKNKITKINGFSAKLKSQSDNIVHVGPAKKASTAESTSQRRKGGSSTSLNTKSEKNITPLQNVGSAQTRAIESKAFSTAGRNMSYASVCASNVSKKQVVQHGQQLTQYNVKFNKDPVEMFTNVTQFYPRKELSTSKQSNSVIKENIQTLLSQHADGLSVFQLQKLYLFMFHHPLKSKGSITVKHLLLDLKDVVKTEGVGVQMHVFPVSSERNTSTAANDATLKGTGSLFTHHYHKKEVVLKPDSWDVMKTQNAELQNSAHDDQSLISGQHQMDCMDGHITKLMQTEHKPTTPENTKSNAHNVEFLREEHSVPVLQPMKSYTQIPHEMSNDQNETSYLSKNVMEKSTSQNEPSPNDSYLPELILHSSGFSFVMKQQVREPLCTAIEMDLDDSKTCLTAQKMPCHSSNILLSYTNSSVSSQDTELQQLSVFHPEITPENNSFNTMHIQEKTKSPDVQQSSDSQTASTCNKAEYPSSHPRDGPQTKPSLMKKICQQHKASVSPPSSKVFSPGQCVHSTEQVQPVLPEVHAVVNVCTSKDKNKSLQAQQSDDTAECIAQADILSSAPRQKNVDFLLNIPKQPEKPASQLKINVESLSKHEEMKNTWQTSQGQTCCVL